MSELVPTSDSGADDEPALGPTPETPLVFVSYASRDAALAAELRRLLAEDGYRVWMAPDEIRGARPWAEQILEAIAAMSLMVVVVSSEAVGSAHVAREVNLALDRAKPVLPVRIEEVALSGSLQYLLALVQWVDAFPTPLSHHRDRLSKRIADVLKDGGQGLAVQGLSGDFPRPRTLGGGNLPTQPTSFVGRDQELEEVAKLVRGSRLVTLTGVGGAGKTRLALQAAGTMAAEFHDGVWLVDLAPLSVPDLVVQRVAAVFKVNEQVNRDLLESLADHLRSRRCLVVLDNCEHLIDEASRVAAALLGSTEGCRILATSRERLRLPGEAAYAVPPLEIPEPSRSSDLQTLRRFDSVRLFIERAEAVGPAFRLTSDTAPSIMEICRRLDGLPLAIELAAARLSSLSPQQIASHLDQRFRLLAGNRRGVVRRQETLRATIDWSYELLTEPERLALQRLSVFRGGFSLEAAQRILAGEGLDYPDLLDIMPPLVDKSLIVAEPADGEMRYRMLETIREYSSERWEPTGERQSFERRHADYFLEMAETAAGSLGQSAKHEEWMHRLGMELDNLRQVLRWVLTTGETENGLRLAGALYRFWMLSDHPSEGAWWLNTILDADVGATDPVRAKALLGYGSLAAQLVGQAPKALQALREAVEIYRSLPDNITVDHSSALNNLAGMLLLTGDHFEVEALYEEALEISRRLNSQWGVALMLGNLGRLAAKDGRIELARDRFDEAEVAARDLGSPFLVGNVLINRANVERDWGSPQLALTAYEGAIEAQLTAPQASGAPLSRASMAIAYLRLGQVDDALQLFLQNASVVLAEEELALQTGVVAELALGRAEIDLALGAFDRAAVLIGSIDRLAESGDIGDFVARHVQLKAEAEKRLDSGKFEAALARGRHIDPNELHQLIAGTADAMS